MRPVRNSGCRIVVAETSPLVRHGLCALLDEEPGLHIVGAAGDFHETCEMLPHLRPDVLLLDVALVPPAEHAIVRDLAVEHPDLRVIAMTTHHPRDDAHALQLGADATLAKDAPLEVVLLCIRSAMAARHGGARAALRPWPDRSSSEPVRDAVDSNFKLTPRERQVLAAIAGGATNKEIAGRLAISLDTVKHHLSSIFSKTSLPNRLALGTFAITHRLVS